MQNKPSTFRFSLRALFMVTAFVGLGLLALMYPLHWVPFAITLAVAFLFAYSIVAVLASKGSRRLFWAAFAATAAAILLLSENIFSQFLPHDWMTSIFLHLHPTDEMGVQNRDADMGFVQTVNRLLTITISTVAAYIIPWLVQRGQKPAGD